MNPSLIGWKSIQNEFDFDQIDFRLKISALRFEEGSLNLMGIFALGAALDLLFEAGINRIEKMVLKIGNLIIKKAEERDLVIKSPRAKEERGGIVSIAGNADAVLLASEPVIAESSDHAISRSPPVSSSFHV